jgi:vitamin B12 transporter
LGGRLEDNTSFQRVEFSPRASAALRFPETDTTIRSAGGRGIKAPSFTETNSLNPFFLGNAALQPEENISWEVGVDQWLFKDKLQGGLTYFENNFTNLIQYAQTGFTTGSFFNIAGAKTKGLEFYLTASPVEGLTVRTAYTYLPDLRVTDDGGIQNINIITGANLLRRPRQTWSFDINYVYKPFEINFNGLYVGARADRRPDNNPPYYALRVNNGGYFIANLAAYYTIVSDVGYLKRLQLMARVNNLFDKNYTEVFGYSSPRFNVIGGLRLEM